MARPRSRSYRRVVTSGIRIWRISAPPVATGRDHCMRHGHSAKHFLAIPICCLDLHESLSPLRGSGFPSFLPPSSKCSFCLNRIADPEPNLRGLVACKGHHQTSSSVRFWEIMKHCPYTCARPVADSPGTCGSSLLRLRPRLTRLTTHAVTVFNVLTFGAQPTAPPTTHRHQAAINAVPAPAAALYSPPEPSESPHRCIRPTT